MGMPSIAYRLGVVLWMWVSIITVNYGTVADRSGVTYDGTSLIINGERKLLFSGSIHYPRSTPEMWPDLIAKAKGGGLNVIQTYVFWNVHEPVRGQFNFEGRFDLLKFVKLIHEQGLYVTLRIGPYIEAEWNFGGFPFWLHDVTGIVFRTDNKPFKREMHRFTAEIVRRMKAESLFASQGGPIILSQIENEYANVEGRFGESGISYVKWAANMAVRLKTRVPWIMCKQPDAPDPVISTCNGEYCGETFIGLSSNKKPKLWTELWTGWFQVFGGTAPHRPVEDIAYAVARFFAKNGTHVNYYMYHGGTNFGRSGGPFVTTSYDYDAPIDEYGIIRQPKWGHLKDLHAALQLCSKALLSGTPNYLSLGSSQEAHVYRGESGICAAFLSNRDSKHDVSVNFENCTYDLPAWSVSILPDCKNVAFNTAKVNTQSNFLKLITPHMKLGSSQTLQNKEVDEGMKWETFREEIGVDMETYFQAMGLLEHINTTKDVSDYLWYTTSIDVNEDEPFLKSNVLLMLTIESRGDAVNVFINHVFVGSAHGNSTNLGFQFELHVHLNPGKNDIALLSVVVGLLNHGAYYERKGAGISNVAIQGFKNGTRDLTHELWSYQIGVTGENLKIYSKNGSQSVNWISASSTTRNQPMTWYKTTLNAPDGDEPIALDLSSMGKGLAWINGENIGRYWVSLLAPPGNCSRPCDYRGNYTLKKCATDCGQPSQRLYHVPRSLLQPTGNLLVLFEETGGDPSKISLGTRSVSSICGYVSEKHLPPVEHWQKIVTYCPSLHENVKPRLQLECPMGKIISSIEFASFGNPQGACGDFTEGACHSPQSRDVAEHACVGQHECSITISSENFGKDPCFGTLKSLAVEAICS